MILASAGSGKTYQLTNRYVQLLAGGASPGRIAALTFTRKAAGEFFDEILGKLARAAEEPVFAAKLAADIGRQELAPADFAGMLRSVVDSMHQLNLGTLDGFFARVVRAFSLELGLGGDFEILPEQAVHLERRRALRQLFAPSSGVPEGARRDFIEAFKRATFGAEEKSLGRLIDEFVGRNIEVYLAAPNGARWGQAGAIWPGGCPWLDAKGDRDAAARKLEAALPWDTLAKGQEARWRDFFLELRGWEPGAALPKPVGYIVGHALDVWPEAGTLMVERRRVSLPAPAASALQRLVAAVVGLELDRRLEMTKGLFAVLRAYEEVYDSAVRRTGRLTFSDLQRLLLPDGPDGAPPLSCRPGGDERLFIDWRLDARIEHWLLDEFQDTSFGQWSVLRNLIDETVQDPTGSRSFFYVGDAKQAIYGWRGGDSRLFREIHDHYNKASRGVIEVRHLEVSRRSGPAVIAMVNRVFGAGEAFRRLFPEEAAARWTGEWRAHESAKPGLSGFAELRTAADKSARLDGTLEILRETEPLARGLDAAVLVRTNDMASELAEHLRKGGFRAVAESDLGVGSDNPLTAGLVAMFQVAAHPGDRAAWGHVAMTPLRAALQERGIRNRDGLSLHLLREVHAVGFERTIVRWLDLLDPRLKAEDEFSRERGRQFAEAGRRFDATGSRDLAEFAGFAGEYTVRDAESAGIIRVMTVHKAKGLGFDLVILPDLEGNSLDIRRREELAVARAADRSVKWVLEWPSQDAWRKDPVLATHAAEAEADACYENLCLLYVAMTRAKRALYMITEPVGNSKARNFPRLLQDTLGEAWSEGDPAWHKAIPLAPVHSGGEGIRLAGETMRMPRAPRRPARRPSAERAGAVVGAALLFAAEPEGAAAFGAAVHSLLAEVEWCGTPGDAGLLEAAWRARGTEAGILGAAAACLRDPGLAPVWRRPSANAEVWRERSFEAVLDGAWVTGVFDRVIVEREAGGRPTAAWVFDFKTDRIADPADTAAGAERHRPQLEWYRRAAAVLAGLAPSAVQAGIVFTHPGRIVFLKP
jgi:ATP-dependent exoDNAse (exonuclease V) beta subunit